MTKLSMLWRKYFETKSQPEKEAILKKICPGITEEGLEIMKRKMPVSGEPINKGISQEAINTLLDLSLTTEEALNKSAEITIREAVRMKRKKKQKSDYISDEDFQRMMKLQMAETRQEALEILRADPNLTEEQIQRMIELWPEEFAELNKPGEPEKGGALKMTKESRDDMIYRWSMTRDLQEFVRLGKALHPEISEEFWTQAFKDSVETGSQSK